MPVWAILAHDFTASQEEGEQRQCLDIASRAIDDARPGDRLQLRLIGAQSYASDMLVFDLEVPEREQAGGYFDIGAAVTDHDGLHAVRVDSVKSDARERLRSLDARPRERYTDIWGALAAGSATLAGAPAGTGRVLVMCADLDENRHRIVPFDLTGVTVILAISVERGGDTREVYARREEWASVLRERGAEVVSLPPGERLRIDAYRNVSSATQSAAIPNP